MKKIYKYSLLIIITLGICFFGGKIIFGDNLSKGISETLGVSSEETFMAEYVPTEYGPIGTRYVGPGVSSIPCGSSVWVTSCNSSTCAAVYDSNTYYISRVKLRNVEPTDECGTSVGTTTKEITTTKRTTTTKKPSSGGLAPVVVPVQEPILTNSIEDYKYVGNYDNPSVGYKLTCGDKVYITTCADDTSEAYCIVTKVNGASISNTKVVRGALRTSNSFAECGAVTRHSLGATFYINSALTIGKSTVPCGDEVTFVKPIEEACLSNEYCEVKYKGDLIYVERAKLGIDKPSSSVCNLEAEETPKEVIEEEECKTSKPLLKQKSSEEEQLKICYNKKNKEAIAEDEYEVFTCDKGYHREMKEVSKYNTCSKAPNNEICSKVFSYNCTSVLRPTLEGSGSLVQFNGKGSLTIKGKDSLTNTGLKGYFLYTDQAPTASSKPELFPNNQYEKEIPNVNSGTYFVSVMTNDNAISYPLTLSVHDDEITTTADIILASPDGNLNYTVTKLEKGKIGYESNISSSDYVRLSNQLNNDSTLASGFDLFTTGYEVTVDADKIAVYATLKSTDASYVEGYGNRTVDLNYGRNVILVKIINNKGRERTYTFVVNRNDSRKNENVLSNLTTSVGNISFDPYVSDYTISVPKNATSVTINGTLSSSTAAFVVGYEPRVVNLDNDITSALIKTISEAGIIRNYILTFVKTGAILEQNYENSVYLSSLSLHGVDIYFDKENVSYTASVGYEVENLAVYAFPESPNAIVDVRGNIGLQVGPNKLEVLVTNGSLSKMYNIFINRKEDGLQVSSNTKLETLTVKDYDLLFNPDVEDYSIKIKREKTLLLTATPQSNRSEVYMYGNNDLTAYSTIRIKVIAENGDTGLYSVDIIKDLYDKQLETTAAIVGGIIIFGAAIIILVRKKRKSIKDYIEV
ncbi:MAG: hypothetical protein PHD03_01575 [Bacilli bacterium]|nr:hypothetical protein [Bacilli bacterium]MDD4406842.1 hypothetical protein [Bacilli bacterium]